MKNAFCFLLLLLPISLFAQVYNVLTYATNNEIVNGIKIKTQIPVSAHQQPIIHIEGYELNIGPINLDIGWYAEGGSLQWASCSSAGGYAPTITLSVVSGKIHIYMGGAGGYAYAPRFAITAYAEGLEETSAMFTGWTVADEALSGSNQTPAYSYNFFGGQISAAGPAYTNSVQSNTKLLVGARAVIGSTDSDIKEVLQVAGSVAVNSNTNSYKFNNYTTNQGVSKYITTGYGGTLKLDTAGNLLFANTAVSGAGEATATLINRLAINKNGNMGLGTTDPRELVHVNGNVTTQGNNKGYLFNVYNNSGYKYAATGFGAALTYDSLGNLVFANTTSSGAANAAATLNKVFILDKDGTLLSKKIKVTQTGWADYVFEPTYKLPSLHQVEQFIKQHKHLPDVPSAAQIEAEGNDLAETQSILLKKIEELTLYLIDQNKEIQELQSIIKKLGTHEE